MSLQALARALTVAGVATARGGRLDGYSGASGAGADGGLIAGTSIAVLMPSRTVPSSSIFS
jgi:hypothetical protein